MPKYGETYYCVYKNVIYEHIWYGDFCDRLQWELHNCFPDRRTARKYLIDTETPEEFFDPRRDYRDDALGKYCLMRRD